MSRELPSADDMHAIDKNKAGKRCAAVTTAVMENGECVSLFPSF